jgi:hypothetical protein
MSNKKTKGIKPNSHIQSLKVVIESSTTQKSFEIFPAYLANTLRNLNFDLTPTVTINDWHETKDAIRIKQLSKRNYLLYIVGDCYAIPFPTLEEAIFEIVSYVETNILSILQPEIKETIQ